MYKYNRKVDHQDDLKGAIINRHLKFWRALCPSKVFGDRPGTISQGNSHFVLQGDLALIRSKSITIMRRFVRCSTV